MRILIVEKHGLVLQCLQHVLAGESDVDVIASVTTVSDATNYLERADLALVNWNLPDSGALTLLRIAQDADNPVRVVATAVPDNDEEILRCIESGAAGYLSQSGTLDEILQTIRAVHAGEAFLPPRIAASLMARVATLTRQTGESNVRAEVLDALTDRELEVLALIRKGMSNSEIAAELIIEVGTVKNHVHSILKKLEVPSRRAAAAMLPEDVEIPGITRFVPAPPPPRQQVIPNPTYALLEAQGVASAVS